MKFNDITGQKFGRLTVTHRDMSTKKTKWHCVCECGNTSNVMAYNLMSGHTSSCGCYQNEQTSKANKTHGQSHSIEYCTWSRMKQRCYDTTSKSYPDYGGRGIDICDRWVDSFANFFADMGYRPKEFESIDRIDNDKGYSPNNCRWATRTQQMRNMRNNNRVSYKGVTMCIVEWAEELGMSEDLISQRLINGWGVEDTFNRPVQSAAST